MPSCELDLPALVRWEEIDSLLDWPSIRLATLGPSNDNPFLSDDTSKAFRMVQRALTRWAPRDLYTMEILETEGHFILNDPRNNLPLTHGFIDLKMKLLREYKEFSAALVGKNFIIDWKTSKGTLDKVWETRLADSWQGKLYTVGDGCQHIIFRGISQNEDVGERECIFQMPPAEEVQGQVFQQFRLYRAMMLMHEDFITPELPSWSRHMPYACGAYRHECTYKLDCTTNSAPYINIPVEILHKPVSYSSGERLALCPEKHRRYLIQREGLDPSVTSDEDDSEDTDETNLGNAVHRGLQEAYNQLRELRLKGTL